LGRDKSVGKSSERGSSLRKLSGNIN